MFDASYALGIMTFNSLGTVFVLAVWEYFKVRRELTEDQAKSREIGVAHGAPQYVPTHN